MNGPAKRKCLKCGKEFPSDGKHNRLCRHCNTSNKTAYEKEEVQDPQRTYYRSNSNIHKAI